MTPRTNVLLGAVLVALATVGCKPDVEPDELDETAPTVLAITPADGAVDVAPDVHVVVTFSEDLDPATAGASSLSLTAGALEVAGDVVLDGDTLTFTPAAALTGSTTYEVGLSATLADLAGNALGTVSPTTFTVAWDPGESNIVYLSYDDEESPDGYVVVRRADLQGAAVLSTTVLSAADWSRTADVELLRLSPDGTKVAVVAAGKDAAPRTELYVVPLAGGEAPTRVSHTMADDGEVYWFRWSPDGTKLAYVADDDGSRDVSHPAVYVVEADGDDDHQVSEATHVVADNFVLWSPDGSRVLYIDDSDEPEARHLWAVPMKGGTPVDVSQARVDWDRDDVPRFSPSGTRLAFNTRFALYVTDLSGMAPVEVTDPKNHAFWFFRWLDDDHLMWAGCVTCYGETLYRSAVTGGPAVPIVPGQAPIVSAAVSPNAKYVVYFAGAGGIWLADPWAAEPNSDLLSRGEFDFQGGRDWEAPVWSPDSAWILYRSQETNTSPHQLRLVSRDGSTWLTLTDLDDEYRDAVPKNSYGFTPDGAWVTYGVLDDDILDGKGRLHRVRLDGSDDIVINDNAMTDADAYQVRDSAGISPLRALWTLW